MKLVNFSVTNYRSITKAHKINLQDFTVLVGKNNEGKSNLLTALNAAMNILVYYGRMGVKATLRGRYSKEMYNWERDFPIQLKQRKNGLESIFKLEFQLENDELSIFHREMGIRGNENIPVQIKIGRDNNFVIRVPKRGSSAYNKKSTEIADFISKRITFNYIQAIRTEGMALNVLRDVIIQQLRTLTENDEYNECVRKINNFQQEILDKIAFQLKEPLKVFLPQLNAVSITKKTDDFLNRMIRNDIEIIIDDGIATSISYKGDGIKSLATLAILKDTMPSEGASIIAIEEPESHLHSGAIHTLVEVIRNISKNSQVIITTHNPLFVQQNVIKSNIIVDNGTAQSARNISEIRSVLGVLPSDNLRNANKVLLVEGEDDIISLTKILSFISPKISSALSSNRLIIKSMGGVGNLAHDLADLKHCMCKYFVLIDNDKAGISAIEKAVSLNLLSEADYKVTMCNGSPESEFEDCLRPCIYEKILLDKFLIDIHSQKFRNNKKWSERIKDVSQSQGNRWTESIEKSIKLSVAESIPDRILDINDVIINEKSGFIFGLVDSLEKMIDL
ncbi:MAG: AAA family ATPase [Eubacterium sp.]|nr:AAA family ATPase [Eubacterium sp.]